MWRNQKFAWDDILGGFPKTMSWNMKRQQKGFWHGCPEAVSSDSWTGTECPGRALWRPRFTSTAASCTPPHLHDSSPSHCGHFSFTWVQRWHPPLGHHRGPEGQWVQYPSSLSPSLRPSSCPVTLTFFLSPPSPCSPPTSQPPPEVREWRWRLPEHSAHLSLSWQCDPQAGESFSTVVYLNNKKKQWMEKEKHSLLFSQWTLRKHWHVVCDVTHDTLKCTECESDPADCYESITNMKRFESSSSGGISWRCLL